jgi:hypothetical protein
LLGIAVVRIGHVATMPDYKIMTIPDEYGRISAVIHPLAQQTKTTKTTTRKKRRGKT